ncbi:lytic transglycosylase domain-containing protein [Elusimicrobiota bacterium]
MRIALRSFLLAATALAVMPMGSSGRPTALPRAAFFGDLSAIRSAVLTRIKEDLPEDRAHRTVLKRLEGTPVTREFIDQAFTDPRVRIEQSVVDRFNKPGESLPYERYRRIFITPARIKAGREFYAANKPLMDEIAGSYGVDPMILLSIVGVETYFGRYGGQFTVFNALYTAIHKVPRRSEWAARELAQFLIYAFSDEVPPHSIKGSYAGAFGYFQFIPSSFNAYAVDYDGDGVRRPDEWPDVLASVANYLVENGYRPGDADYSEGGSIWRSIYAYNHSDKYVKVVLELRQEILKGVDHRAN